MSGEIWIAFSGKADVQFLKFLRPGFRHCFALLRGPDTWLVVDPMLHKLEVQATLCAADFDLPAWMRARGYRVTRAPRLPTPARALLPAPFTCVEAMKRLIGLRAWWVLTPWQLYRRLVSFNTQQGEPYGKPVFKN